MDGDLAIWGTVFILVISPFVTALVKQWEFARDLGVPINGAVAVLAFIGLWAATSGDPELLATFVERAIIVAFGGSAAVAVGKRLKDGLNGGGRPRIKTA